MREIVFEFVEVKQLADKHEEGVDHETLAMDLELVPMTVPHLPDQHWVHWQHDAELPELLY